MTLVERARMPLRARPEICSLVMGSTNLGLYPMLERYKELKFDWASREETRARTRRARARAKRGKQLDF